MTSRRIFVARPRTDDAAVIGVAANETLALRIAENLEQEILANGWTIGSSLGKEEELVQRYGVGRWVMREALAIAERDGLIEMRRGRNGGIFISAPAESVLETTVRNYLLFTPIKVNDIALMRQCLEQIAHELAAASATPEQIEQARQILTHYKQKKHFGALIDTKDPSEQLYAMTNNRFVRIFGHILSQLTYSLGICMGSMHYDPEKITPLTQRLLELRLEQLACAVAADARGAVEASREVFDVMVAMLIDSPHRGEKFFLGKTPKYIAPLAQRLVDSFPRDRPARRADSLIVQLQLDILRYELRAGDSIAPEDFLMDYYSVGRNGLREVVRALQRDNFVAALGGRQGGLCVSTPVPDAIIRSNIAYFRFLDISAQELAAAARPLILMTAELVAAKSKRTGRESIARELAIIDEMRARSSIDCNDAGDLFRALTRGNGNPIHELFIDTLVGLGFSLAATSDAVYPHINTGQLAAIMGQLRQSFEAGDTIFARRHAAELLRATQVMHLHD